MDTKTIGVRLTDKFYKRLEQVANSKMLSISSLIKLIVAENISDYEEIDKTGYESAVTETLRGR